MRRLSRSRSSLVGAALACSRSAVDDLRVEQRDDEHERAEEHHRAERNEAAGKAFGIHGGLLSAKAMGN